MAFTAFTDLLPAMQNRLPDCNAYMIEQALMLGCRDFCRDSEAYVVQLTAIDATEDTKEYTLSIPTQFDVVRVHEVRRRTEDEVTDDEKGTVIDEGEYDFHIDTNVLEFFTAPFSEDITDGLVVKLSLMPQEDEDDTELDFDWVNRYVNYIKAWAFYHLQSMAQTPWFAPQQAAMNFAKFREGVGLARRELYTGFTRRQLRFQGGNFL